MASLAFQADTTMMSSGVMGADMAQAQPMQDMYEVTFGEGWRLTGMTQAFPIYTRGRTRDGGSPLDDDGFYLTQAAAMINLESPRRRFVLRVTPNFEGWTQGDGELTFGGWGEGFIDKRHPHTLVHEAMVSVNFWDERHGGFSISGGKGFAPFGTDDPMSRPSVKYPTNHHLSQILERFTLNAVWQYGPWGVEAGVFGGSEPDGPYDFSNVESFGDSWSTRVSRRFGSVGMGRWAWETSASYARVAPGEHEEEPGPATEVETGPTILYNGAVRFEGAATPDSRLYALVEYSVNDPAEEEGDWSLLGEARWVRGRHAPYVRFERSTRPEYPRDGVSGEGFFRYDHDAEPIGGTAWSIASLGYGFTATKGTVSVRPFVEAQFFSAAGERGGVSAQELFGDDGFTSFSVGARLFFGGEPMRMGSYGVLDPMSRMADMNSMTEMSGM